MALRWCDGRRNTAAPGSSSRVRSRNADWTFTGYAGISGNGSAFGAASAPSGTQVALIQGYGGANGTMTQSVSFDAGTYYLKFQAAQRSGGTQTVDVYIDSTLIASVTPDATDFTTYTTPDFTVTSGTHDIMTSSSLVTHPRATTPPSSTQCRSSKRHRQVCSTAVSRHRTWTVEASIGLRTQSGGFFDYAGLLGNGSAFGNANAPDGDQVALLQSYGGVNGQIEQRVGLASGTYYLSFQASKRTNYGVWWAADVRCVCRFDADRDHHA